MGVECDDLLGVARCLTNVLPNDGPSEVKTSTPAIENVICTWRTGVIQAGWASDGFPPDRSFASVVMKGSSFCANELTFAVAVASLACRTLSRRSAEDRLICSSSRNKGLGFFMLPLP